MQNSDDPETEDLRGKDVGSESASGTAFAVAGEESERADCGKIPFSFAGILMLPVLLYRKCISPLLPPTCRFVPTCSAYALEALQVHGAWRGSYLTVRRLLRCHPWGGSGYDPVPPGKVKSETTKTK